MARIRSIKPETPQDAGLARVSRDARLTFLYLLTQADDAGWFRASGRMLLGALYPHDPDVTEAMLIGWLDELRHRGRLEAFDTDEGIIGRIVNFSKHQRIDHPSKSHLASLSRTIRERFAKGVLSLGVFSPESVLKAGAADSAAPVVGDISPEEQETNGAWYGRVLKPLLLRKPYPAPAALHEMQSRDISILGRQLKSRQRADIEDAVREMREQAEDGQLAGWVEPGQTFTLKAMVSESNGGIATFDRFRHAAVKRREIAGAA